jgi:peptidoglycan hydrolase-like protein with peptidoglycan-binding domain
MAAPKRKSPKKKPVRNAPGIVSLAFTAMVRAAARHPRSVGGTVAFVVVFGFVAANALWYQPGSHPSPFLRTRDEDDRNGIAGYRTTTQLDHQGDVTTFRIERENTATEAPATTADNQQSSPQAAPAQASPLVAEIQQELARRGLYEGKADGVPGPRTTAAILFFEETVGMEQTGEASTRVLSALKIDGATVSAIPKERPSEAINDTGVSIDPVAAAIRNAANVNATPKAQPISAVSKPVTNDMVAKIQQGLVNIAYADVTVDGLAGQQTRNAIRNFEKHYRLPETGEPNEAVLKKLKSIGAL